MKKEAGFNEEQGAKFGELCEKFLEEYSNKLKNKLKFSNFKLEEMQRTQEILHNLVKNLETKNAELEKKIDEHNSFFDKLRDEFERKIGEMEKKGK